MTEEMKDTKTKDQQNVTGWNTDLSKRDRIIVGMDAGGTKTKIDLADETGLVLDGFSGGGMNVNSYGVEVTGAHFAQILEKIEKKIGSLDKVAALCIGVAGATNPSTREVITKVMAEKGMNCPVKIVGDHIIALYAAKGTGEGMILIAGTGSVCFGRKVGTNGEEFIGRAGGWGHLIDDPGSGYYIGREMLSAIVQAEDGREKPSIMWPLLQNTLGIHDMAGLISFTYGPNTGKREIAALSQIVQEAVRKQDEVAIRITRKAAVCLADMIVAVAKQMQQTEGEVVMNGGELVHNEPLRLMLREILKEKLPGFTLTWPRLDASEGAVIAACELLKDTV